VFGTVKRTCFPDELTDQFSAQVQAYKQDRKKKKASSKVQHHSVLAHAFETFGSQEKADHWLRRPNRLFNGRAPLEVIESDPQAVEIELTKIDHGVYV
jgi:uncharacterized protein (DUF2384 family)